jgi:hypothetical protein
MTLYKPLMTTTVEDALARGAGLLKRPPPDPGEVPLC